MEYISGLLVSVAILIMGFELIKSSVEKIISPEPIDSSPVVYGILAASILVKLYMGFYNRAVGKKISSAAMGATAMDSISDTVSTALVLLATFISQKTGLILDGWFGVLVGVFIFVSGVRSMKETVDPLLRQAPGEGTGGPDPENCDQLSQRLWHARSDCPRLWSRQTDDLPPCGDSGGWGPDGNPR